MVKLWLSIAQSLKIDFGEKKRKPKKYLQSQNNSQCSKHLPAYYVISLVDVRSKLKTFFLIILPRLPTFHVGAAVK